MRLQEIMGRFQYWKSVDRIGPDHPYTHWKLHFKSTMIDLCTTKFKHFGTGAEFRPGAYAVNCSNISIGKRVVIRPNSMIFADASHDNGAGITIEDDVLLGGGVHIYVGNHRFDDPFTPVIDQGYYPSVPVVIRKGAWIGANVMILPGVTIGKNAVIGAGSIVSKDIPGQVLAVGNPAKVIKILGRD